MKRRTYVSASEDSEHSSAAPARQPRRHTVALAFTIATVSTVFFLLLLGIRSIRGHSTATGSHAEGSLAREIQAFLEQNPKLSTPPAESVAIQQLFFVSCNRHDRSQAYWGLMAVAAQCEVLSEEDRLAAAPCRRLYTGASPLSRDGRALPEEKEEAAINAATPATPPVFEKEVPLGACGSVYDTTNAEALRTTLWNLAKLQQQQRPDIQVAGSPSPRFQAAALQRDRAPLDALLWLGDAIYADKQADGQEYQSLLFHHENSLEEVEVFWKIQRDAPSYNAFQRSCIAATATRLSPNSNPSVLPRNVWGTWDDHDMGKNDGGKEYAHRDVTQRYFLDFLRAPLDDPRWNRAGVYEAYTLPFHAVIGENKGWGAPVEGLLEQLYVQAVCVILLDVRSFRDPPNATCDGDMLGATQWEWFEQQLVRFTTRTSDGRDPCAMILIGGGIQFILDEKTAENWAAFLKSRDRLLGLLKAYRTERVAFLTGDVHMGELGGDFTPYAITQVLGYPVLEATSSGLTHSANMFHAAHALPRIFHSPRRLGIYVEKNFGSFKLSLNLQHLSRLRPYLRNTENEETKYPPLETPEQRQEAREIVQRAVNVTFTIFSIPHKGQPVLRLNFPLSMLTLKEGPAYVGATVDVYHGYVSLRPGSTAPTSPTDPLQQQQQQGRAPSATHDVPGISIQLQNGTTMTVAHYPPSSPVPFVTWYTRLMQRYVFANSSVSKSLMQTLFLNVVLSSVLFVVGLWWLWRRTRQQRYCKGGYQPASTSIPASKAGEAPGGAGDGAQRSPRTPLPHLGVGVSQQWWNRLFHGSAKGKKR